MRKCRSWSVIAGLVFAMGFVVLTSRLILLQENASDFDESYDAYQRVETLEMESSTTSPKTEKQRYVTPSLAELGNRALLPEAYKHVLMVTRVPGAGIEILVLLLQRLQGYNAFKHIRLPQGDEGLLSTLQQELLVEEITSIIRQEAVPLTFDGNVRFLNFSQYGRQSPTYISMIRDPLDPRTLHRVENGNLATIYLGAISHFCGHDPRCSERNNEWALEQAKANVIKWYPVVGILNYMNDTLKVLEENFPYFFAGASYIYKKLSPKMIKFHNNYATIEPETAEHLRRLLKTEVEFYEWIKSRLLNGIIENE